MRGNGRGRENFYAIVKTADDQVISLWISDDGKIIDTVFIIAMESELNQFFTDILATKIPEFKLKTQNTYSNLKIFVMGLFICMFVKI